MERIKNYIDKITEYIGYLCGILVFLLALNIFYDVIMRYLFNRSSIFMQELEWHIFSGIFLLSMGYALKHNAHVRVDLIYDKLSMKKKAIINIFGTLFFILPLSILVIYTSIDFVSYAYEIKEKSPDPGGIPYRYIIKGLIPLSFIFLILQSISFFIHNLQIVLNKSKM